MRTTLVPLVLSGALLVVLYTTGQRLFVIQTGSMAPTAPAGSIVLTTPTRPAIGDVVTIQRPGGALPLTHRIVGERAGQFQTKGDANQAPDPGLVAPGDILGKVEVIVPYLGYILAPLWVMPVLSWILLAIAVLLYLSLSLQQGVRVRMQRQSAPRQ